MLLTEIAFNKTRIFDGAMPNGDHVSFVVKFEGATSTGVHMWFGKMKVENELPKEVALAVGEDGVIVAINFTAPEDALSEVFTVNQRAFGPSLKASRNWRVDGYKGIKLENYL